MGVFLWLLVIKIQQLIAFGNLQNQGFHPYICNQKVPGNNDD